MSTLAPLARLVDVYTAGQGATLDSETAAAFSRYGALSPAERQRVCRLVATSGATLAMAVAAVEATRAAEGQSNE